MNPLASYTEADLRRTGFLTVSWTQAEWDRQLDGDWMNPHPALTPEQWAERVSELESLPL